jgi:type IV pilus assembly protein PilV
MMKMISKGDGFSLIEVMVAILVLAIGILAWAGLQDNNIEGRSTSGRMTTGIELAQSLVEEKAAEAMDRSDSHNATNGTESLTIDNVVYQMDWTVNKGSGTNGGDLFAGGKAIWEVTVDNRWDHFGQHRVYYERVVIGR